MKKRVIAILLAAVVLMTLPAALVAALEAPPPFLLKWGSYGTGDGQFWEAMGVEVDSAGNVYVADFWNGRIQKFDSNGNFLVKWGSPGNGDGKFNLPYGVAFDSEGNIYVADGGNHRIQKFDSNRNFLIKWGSSGTGDGQFIFPMGIAVDSQNNIYVADYIEWPITSRIQKFDSSGTFLKKWNCSGATDVDIDSSDNVYVVSWWHRIQKFNADGGLLKTWGSPGTGDGKLINPRGIAVDSSGNVYVADGGNHRIQKFDSNGNFLIKWGSKGAGSGQFDTPSSVDVDVQGNIYVADAKNHRIQVFTGNQPPIADAGSDQTAIVGEEITFDGSNSDDVDGTIVSYDWDFDDSAIGSGGITTHSYSSGGIYEVTLTVTDDDEATDTDTTIVTVQTPEGAIQDLISDVEGMNLAKGVENSLTSKLEAAIRSLNRDQKNVATNQLYAFINEIEAQRDKKITNEQADELIAKAQRVIDNI